MSADYVTYYKDSLDVKDVVRTMMDVQGHDFEDPFFICDLSEVFRKLLLWKRYMPRIAPYYAIKCNPYTPLLQTLAKLGMGFDCASSNEIEKVQNFGVNADRIVFANPIKKCSDIIFAKDHAIKRMTFDNECELLKIKKFYPDAELILRFRCDARKAMVVGLGAKSGCDPRTDAKKLVFLAAQLHVKVIGVSFHVGSGCTDYAVFREAIAAAKEIFDFSSEIGLPMTLLDLGGGFTHDLQTFRPVSRVINQAIQKFFPNNDVTIIAEPGRFFAAPAFTLVTKVINVRQSENNGKPHFMYFINCGVHAGFGFMKYGAQFQKPELLVDGDNNKHKCSFWGHTCDPNDKLHENILMPKLDVDDILIYRDFGAYSLSLSSAFNGFQIPKVYNYINVKHENLDPTLGFRRE